MKNGLMLCPTCHLYFDKKEPEIRIKPDGKIVVKGDCLKNDQYKQLNGTKFLGLIKLGKSIIIQQKNCSNLHSP